MEPSPCVEADSHAASKEISCMLHNPKIHYHIHNSSPLDSILIHLIPVYTSSPIS